MQPNTSTVSTHYPMTCLSSDFYAAYFNLSVKQKQVIPKTYFLLAQAIYWMPAAPIHGGDEGTGCFMDSRVERVETCRSSTRSTRSTWLNKMFCIWSRMWLMKLEQSTAQIQLRVFATLISPCLSAAGLLVTRQFLVFISSLPWTKFREEVHLERVGELRRRAERKVHILPQHLRDVRPRHLHPPRQLRLRHPQLLHPPEYPPQKRRADMVNCGQGDLTM